MIKLMFFYFFIYDGLLWVTQKTTSFFQHYIKENHCMFNKLYTQWVACARLHFTQHSRPATNVYKKEYSTNTVEVALASQHTAICTEQCMRETQGGMWGDEHNNTWLWPELNLSGQCKDTEPSSRLFLSKLAPELLKGLFNASLYGLGLFHRQCTDTIILGRCTSKGVNGSIPRARERERGKEQESERGRKREREREREKEREGKSKIRRERKEREGEILNFCM